VTDLEWQITRDNRDISRRGSYSVQVDPTEPVIADYTRCDSIRYQNIVRGTDTGSRAPVRPGIRARGGADCVGVDGVLYAAVALLLADTVLVIVSLQLRGPGEVVALDDPGHPRVVLETAGLAGHVVVVAAVLGHLDLPLVVGGVPHREGEGGRVGGRAAEVQV